MFTCVRFCVSGSWCEPVVRAQLCGVSGGTPPSVARTLLFQVVQGRWSVAQSRQHCFWIQSEYGHLPAGRVTTTVRLHLDISHMCSLTVCDCTFCDRELQVLTRVQYTWT